MKMKLMQVVGLVAAAAALSLVGMANAQEFDFALASSISSNHSTDVSLAAYAFGGDLESASRIKSLPRGLGEQPLAASISGATASEQNSWVISSLAALFVCGLGIVVANVYAQRIRSYRAATPVMLIN